MPGIPLESIPDPARSAWIALRDELLAILGDDLVAMWAFGGTTSVEDPAHPGDLDTYVLLGERPGEATVGRIEAAEAAVGSERDVEWDSWYVLADDARKEDPPRHAWRQGRRDTAWALNRAHFLAGRYVRLHGPDPATIVAAPTRDELESDLSRELEHIERHVLEGDTDPYEATYALLNGSRILHSAGTDDPAISKRAAGAWGLDQLPARWHLALHAALRNYEGRATAEDRDLLAAEMAPFVAFVRERLPLAQERPAGEPPRWSGS
jgi:aminoglycoside adenylyltransferase-like protein